MNEHKGGGRVMLARGFNTGTNRPSSAFADNGPTVMSGRALGLHPVTEALIGVAGVRRRDDRVKRQQLGRAVVAIRHRMGLTQREASDLAGVSHQSMSEIERGVCSTDGPTFRAVTEWVRNVANDELGEG